MPRPRLLQKLDRHVDRPLALISAPEGYGKTVLMSSWLDAGSVPSAWLSLDERDNDLRIFGAYLLAAVRSLHPEVGEKAWSMLQIAAPP